MTIRLHGVKLVENEIELLNNYKGFDITLKPMLQEKYIDGKITEREVYNVFKVYDSKTGYEAFESIRFKSLQDIINYIND